MTRDDYLTSLLLVFMIAYVVAYMGFAICLALWDWWRDR